MNERPKYTQDEILEVLENYHSLLSKLITEKAGGNQPPTTEQELSESPATMNTDV